MPLWIPRRIDVFVHFEKLIIDFEEPKVVTILLTCVTLNPIKFWEIGVKNMQMNSQQESVASLQGVDADGNPTNVVFDSPPSWSSDDPAVVTVTPAPDGLTCVIGSPSPGPVGSAVVTLDGVIKGKTVQATLAVDIIAADAVAVNIVAAPPTP